ncbi:sulfur transferase domain-containing protein [Komagataeibacter rhaeticus]|nr:sulfur transferase domain-containing protein [Komagataeibacter rhaeticus]
MFYVAPQLTVSDINKAAADGFKSILCARPDGEQGIRCPARRLNRLLLPGT